MKNLRTTIAVLLIVISTALYGNEATAANGPTGLHKEASVSVQASNQEGIFHLIYEADEARDIQVVIYNDQNQPLHNQTIKGKSRFRVPFNLRQLAFGTYTVEVNENGKVYREQIVYRPVSYEVQVAYSKQADDKLAMSVIGAEGESVRVLIYDENDHLLYEDAIDGQANFKRVYNFEQAGIEKAEFIVSFNNRIISSETIKF